MAVQRDLFIDIDRGPNASRERPTGLSHRTTQSSNPLWPAAEGAPARRRPFEAGTSPLGIVPVESLRLGSATPAEPAPGKTRSIFPDLAESLAALHPGASASRPLSLADALAAMPAVPAASPVTRAWLFPSEPEMPAGSKPASVEEPPSLGRLPPGWRTPDGVYHISVPPAEAGPLPEERAADEDDAYLERRYDFTQPAVADLYDRIVVPLWSSPFGRLLLSALQSCPRQPGWQVLDVACGTGYPTLEVAQWVGSSGDVAGLDVWGAGIALARRKVEALRLDNVAFLVADVAQCDLPEQTFDVALCNLGLTNFAWPEAALKGIARLLQPNGTLILTTNLQGTMQEFFETYLGVLNDLGLVGLSWDVERMMQGQPTLESAEALLELAGFTIDQTMSDHFALEFPDGSTFLRSPLVGMGFLQSWRNVVGDLALRRVIFHEIERRLNARAAAWGRLDLIVPMLCVTARRRAEE